MIGAHQKRPSVHKCAVGTPQLPGVPFGWLPLLIYPPTPSTTPPCQRALVGHFLFSAKFICMGKQKNRLTAIQTIYQHAQKNPSRARKFSISRHPPTRPPTHARLHLPSCAHTGTAARPRQPRKMRRTNQCTPPHSATQRNTPLSPTAAPPHPPATTRIQRMHRAAPRRTHAQASAHACARAKRHHQQPPAEPNTPGPRVCSVQCGAERRCSSAHSGGWVAAHHHRTATSLPYTSHSKSGLPYTSPICHLPCTNPAEAGGSSSHSIVFLGFAPLRASFVWEERPTLHLPHIKTHLPCTLRPRPPTLHLTLTLIRYRVG
jgi:hypothetical protein